ncbi:MAG: hypothetical protein ACYDH0_06075 [Candidatus Aminicenantales bacterium]
MNKERHCDYPLRGDLPNRSSDGISDKDIPAFENIKPTPGSEDRPRIPLLDAFGPHIDSRMPAPGFVESMNLLLPHVEDKKPSPFIDRNVQDGAERPAGRSFDFINGT